MPLRRIKKAWNKSRTVWANIIGGVTLLATIIVENEGMLEGLPLPGSASAWITVALTAANLWLRKQGGEPLGKTDEHERNLP